MPFGWESTGDRAYCQFHDLILRSSMPFGWESTGDLHLVSIYRETITCSLQCLSAGSPLGTQGVALVGSFRQNGSSMPFGWESTGDAYRPTLLLSFSQASSMPFGWESTGDAALDQECSERNPVSSMPFGWESTGDPVKRLADVAALTRSSMPFGWESTWDRDPAQ